MQRTPKGNRLHIGIFGRRNVGKSSLLNALTRQQVSIVSDVAGTTTDPVEKPMELAPLGPVLFIDTAGVDDTSDLGGQRVARTKAILDRVDLGILVAQAGRWEAFEESLLQELAAREAPVLVVLNKSDLGPPDLDLEERFRASGVPFLRTAAASGAGIDRLREAIVAAAPEDFVNALPLVGDLVPPGGLAVLVVPIDKEAPKGRLILPQAQVIRDLLDHHAGSVVVQVPELARTIARLAAEPPALVVTDSQAFAEVARQTPPEIPMTSFSILFSRQKGDLAEFARGAGTIAGLRPGDRVLIAEACTHHPIGEDIGRVKIPRWLSEKAGGALDVHISQGHDFPPDLRSYRLVVHCGSCMLTRREVLSRILKCRQAGVPITNYGMAIAWTLGVFERALRPFPGVLDAMRAA
ncbi:MAG: [FeFe] hydrogenase H-cluster maturation GTPase HydF [Candidatus Eisenbacteria bacterium]|nr:[FeFe] hydrogenase H-cluster maturation GTPase HydF [Candidatus Eisenbacteria bacterium]